MATNPLTTHLERLHEKLAKELLEQIEEGGVTPEGVRTRPSASILNVARQFLKDNGIDSVPVEASPLAKLAERLPVFDEEPLMLPDRDGI